jgi:hypothetical protein
MSLEERLAEETSQLREQVKFLPHGPPRDVVLRRIRQNETASQISDWLRWPGLKAPT